MIDEVIADHYLDVVKAAALLRLPPTLTEGLARIPTEGPLARSTGMCERRMVDLQAAVAWAVSLTGGGLRWNWRGDDWRPSPGAF